MKNFKKIILGLSIILTLLVFLEFLAKILNLTLTKKEINDLDLKTEFEEIFVPPLSAKEQGEYRIFVYGGSTVQGIPLPKISFVSQLQYQLNHIFEQKNIKVYNFGWAGFNSTRIRYIFERTITEKPDLIIVYTGENEFIYPQLDFYWLVKGATFMKNRSDLAKTIMYIIKKNDNNQKEKIQSPNQKFTAYAANKVFINTKMRIFKTNLNEIVSESQSRSIPIILGIPAHNIAEWPPTRRELTTLGAPDDYLKVLAVIFELIDKNQLDEADNLLNNSFTGYKDDSMLLYLKATVAKKKGLSPRGLFESAKDADLVPWRTTTSHANFLKSQEGKKNIYVINFPEIFAQNSPNNLTGFNLILDGTHPTKEGAYLLSKSIIDFIKNEELISPAWLKESQDFYSMEDLFKKMKVSEEDDFFVFLKTAHLVLKSPLLNLEASRFYIEKAENIHDQNWETKAVKAAIAHLEGNLQLAHTYLSEAEALKGETISKRDVEDIPYLGEILPN